jgi:HK97 family phage prohead protease
MPLAFKETRLKTLTLAEFAKAVKDGDKPGADTLVKAQFSVKATPDADQPDSRILRFVASDETLDRVGDVIHASGWQLDNFQRNPVILWMHNHDLMPIGRCVEIGVEGKQLVGAVEFAPASINPFAEQVLQAYRGGFLSAVSVGFRALEYKFVQTDERPFGIDFLAQELWEFSAVTVPCNPNALLLGERSAPKPKHAPASVYRSHVQARRGS